MKKLVIASIAGAVAYFVWQMLTWMMIPVHGPTVAALPDEDAVRDALMAQKLESGVYIVPWGDDEEAMMDPESKYYKQHQSGPLFSIFFHKEGADPMAMSVMLFGLLTDLLSVALVATLLRCVSDAKCFATYKARVGFVTAFGIFLALTGHVSYYNWMHFEAYYTAMFVVDAVVGWLIVGLIIAAIIRPNASPSPASSP